MALMSPTQWITPTFLWNIVEQRPNEGRRGFRQSYMQSSMCPFEDVGSRHVLLQRSKEQNPLAGLYSPKGEAIPATDLGYDQIMMTMQDVKAMRYLDADIWQTIVEIGELAVSSAASSAVFKRNAQTVMKHLTRLMNFCDDQVDTTLEYLFMQVLSEGSITWPPTNDAGSTISSPPDYLNSANYSGTWPYPIEADKNQDITTLVDYEGSNPGANIRKVWTDSTADILGALRTIRTLMLEKYAIDMDGATMIMSSVDRDLMLNNTALLNFLAGANKEQPGARTFMSDNELRSALSTVGDMQLKTYNSFWTYEATPTLPGQDSTTTRVKFLKPGKVIFIPKSGINAKMGTVRLQTGPGSNAPWRAGKIAWSYENPKPNFEKQVGVNVVSWPLFPSGHYDWFILDVLN